MRLHNSKAIKNNNSYFYLDRFDQPFQRSTEHGQTGDGSRRTDSERRRGGYNGHSCRTSQDQGFDQRPGTAAKTHHRDSQWGQGCFKTAI